MSLKTARRALERSAGASRSRTAVAFRTLQWSTAALVSWGLAATGEASHLTDVADAADTVMVGDTLEDDPFDLYVGAKFVFDFNSGKITREPIDRAGLDATGCVEANARRCLTVDELRWNRSRQGMILGLQVGLFQDLALTIGLPIWFNDSTQLKYADGVGPVNSTVDPQDPNNPDSTLFANDYGSTRRGVGSLALGLRWAPLNQERDESKPEWVLFFDWAMPWTASVYDPSKGAASKSNPKPMGDGVHYLTVGTAISRRIGNFGLIGIDENANRKGYTDPYFEIKYTIPVPQRGLAPEALVFDDNDNPFGAAPPHVARVSAGFEVLPYENLDAGRHVSIDLGVWGEYTSEGRVYGELTDALGELNYAEQNFKIGALVGVYIKAADFLRFSLGVSVAHRTEHYITNEQVGTDVDGDGQVRPSTPGDPSSDLLNPYFCGNTDGDRCDQTNQASYDQIGYRFKNESNLFVQVFTGFELTF